MLDMPSIMSAPSDLSSKLTAGGKVPAYYYKVLQDVGTRYINVHTLMAAFDFLEAPFQTKVSRDSGRPQVAFRLRRWLNEAETMTGIGEQTR